MAFDWLPTLSNYGVAYSTAGKNVSKGNFVVHCPFCGHADAGQHMSIALDGSGWRCFRRPDHRGKHPARLLAALLQCSLEQAARLVGDAVYIPDDFMGAVTKAMSTELPPAAPHLELPKEFRNFPAEGLKSLPSARPFIRYLKGRGFDDDQIETLTPRYGLRYATRGPFSGRIIFPVRKGSELVSWTGRSISPNAFLRYMSLSPDAELAEEKGLPQAVGPISDYLLFFNLLKKTSAKTLYICEGPFDALKVCVLGRDRDAIATCCFTAAPSAAQIGLLHELFPKFKRKILLLDNGTLPTTLRTASIFAGMGLEIGELPKGVKDPGDLDQRQFDAINRRR